MSINAFYPQGNTVTFTGAVTAPTPIQCVAFTPGVIASNAFRFCNAGNVTVFMGVGPTAATANANAVVVSTTASSIPLVAGAVEVMCFQPYSFFTGITSSGSALIYVTPGEGM
jgi:hypothetical protein